MEGEIRFVNKNLKELFDKLKDIDKELYEELQKARNEIAKDIFCGRNVKKKLIPKEYIQKYNINNLWIYDLRDGWRLLYTIATPTKVEVLAIVLSWMDHKDYERLFKF
ncbi:MAG: hypothetical protein PHD81_03590 [Candidatus Nanoarchaeia archaeon]|nr:hypothetical protein [Candidatus Nanoarchaeia archaeon]MDD5588166.1 hypothetical protein [Candidatus Nanoarchaeia archaeon]